MSERLGVIATKKVTATDDLYQFIDFLNRTLKEKDVIFGMSKSDEENKMLVTVYQAK